MLNEGIIINYFQDDILTKIKYILIEDEEIPLFDVNVQIKAINMDDITYSIY